MNMLLEENVKAISTGIISQLDLDLCQCETFAVSEPVPGLGRRRERGVVCTVYSAFFTLE